MDTPDFSLGSTQALSASSKCKLSKNAAQTLVEGFIQDQWLCLHAGRIGLGIRSVVELEVYLANEYPDAIVDCGVCNGSVLSKVCLVIVVVVKLSLFESLS